MGRASRDGGLVTGVLGLFLQFVIACVMNYVVVPLSAYPYPRRFEPLTMITGVLVHMFLIGVPISLSVRRAFSPAAVQARSSARITVTA
jgi:hypothetical protein